MAGHSPKEPAIAAAATTEPADPIALIENNWKNAQKCRRIIHKELERVQNTGQDGDAAMRCFAEVEELLKKYRLLCLQIIMVDIRAAKERNVEDILWQTHVLVTKTYRKVIGNLQGPGSVVVKRKIEKLYLTYLTTSQSFYRTYVQRFCGSYKVKELERVARVVKFDELPADMQAPVQVVDPEVEELVNLSFHQTLIYLGDLSRYRTLLRPKDRSFDAALTYYALASELMPESGSGYHQTGVIYAEAHNHLEIVYNMYRAIACKWPHPLGKVNLEREFRDLRQQKTGGARSPLEAMVSWFVKLHAFYYQGEEFTGSKEMEDEVDNRLATALKTANGPGIDGILLKMVLINIVAYIVAKDKVQAKWAETGSRSCQFILQLNVRTIHTLSKLLREQLKNLVQQKPSPPAADSDDKEEDQTRFTPSFHRILPLFRVYMTWLNSYSSELTGFRSYLEPQFGSMCKTLADTLTLLLSLLVTANFDLASVVTWLLPEDEETIGINCLNGPELYAGCQLRYDALTRKPKPRADEVTDANFSLDTAAFIRVSDAILCGLRLADNSPFPIAPPDGSHNTFSYVEGLKPQRSSSVPAKPQSQVAVDASATTAVASTTLPTPVGPPVSAPAVKTTAAVASVAEEEDFSDDQEFYPLQAKKARDTLRQVSTAAPGVSQAATVSEFPLDTELSRILNDFLAPPEPSAGRAEFRQEDTSYGMSSKAANEIWGTAASTSPTPGSATSKVFPSLPWDYFLGARSADSGARNAATIRSAGSGWDLRPDSSDSPIPVQGVDNANGPFTPHNEAWNNQSWLGSSAIVSRPSANQSGLDWAAQTARDSKYHGKQGLQAHNIRDMWAKAEGASSMHSRKPSEGTASYPWSPSAAIWQPQQFPAVADPVTPTSSFPSAPQFSGDSSLPQVNSPLGLPAANMQAQTSRSPPVGQNSYVLPSANNLPMACPSYSPYPPPGISGPRGFPPQGPYAYKAGNSTLPQTCAADQPSYYDGLGPMSAWANDAGLKSLWEDAAMTGGENPNALASNLPQVPVVPGGHTASQFGWETAQKPKPK